MFHFVNWYTSFQFNYFDKKSVCSDASPASGNMWDMYRVYPDRKIFHNPYSNFVSLVTFVLVYTPPFKRCTRSQTLMVTMSAKYLASIISLETGCGLTDSPWVLQAKAGQNINISLTSFKYDITNNISQGCGTQYGYIFDLDTEQIVNLCCSGEKTQMVYQTKGHQVQILLHKDAVEKYSFIIKYQGRSSLT